MYGTDRLFVVISGTWWRAKGTAPDSTVPAKPGRFVIHHANQPHYDGAEDEGTVIQVWGMGPLKTKSAAQPR